MFDTRSPTLKYTIAAFFLCTVPAVASLPVSAGSATFGTKPNVVTIDPHHPIAQIAVSSLSARVVSFDVRAHRWTQSAAGDALAPDDASGVLLVPPILSIAPYDTTIIRVTLRQLPPATKIEDSYQIVMTEITAQSAQARVIIVPLFVLPASRSGSVSYILKPRTGNTANLIITNATNAHVFLSKLAIAVEDKTVYSGKASIYVLAGNTRTIPLLLTAPLTGRRADLRFVSEDGSSRSVQATVSR